MEIPNVRWMHQEDAYGCICTVRCGFSRRIYREHFLTSGQSFNEIKSTREAIEAIVANRLNHTVAHDQVTEEPGAIVFKFDFPSSQE